MRFSSRRAAIPVAVAVAMLFPAARVATGAETPMPQTITGIVQTVVREQPPGHRTASNLTGSTRAGDDTTKVLQVGTRIVPLTYGSLASTKNGTKVSVTVLPSAGGASRVVSANALSAPAATTTTAVHHVYVAVVVPAGLTADPSITAASVRAMVTRVSQYWSSQSGGKVTFVTTTVLARYRSAFRCDGTGQDTYNMWNEALARIPAAFGTGRHLVVVAPNLADQHECAYGLGTIGAVQATGNRVFVSGLDQSLLAHELGHNLGLYHSNALRCTGTQDRPMVSLAFPGCQTRPYDDLFDVMGYSGAGYGEGNLNAVHLDGMNLLPTAVRRILSNSGVTTAHITPLSTTTAGRTLKITDPSGAVYFVEYRTNSGRDVVAGHNPWHPQWGVRVLRDDPQAPDTAGSYELDGTPSSSANDYNRAIPLGGTFTAASKKLTVRVVAQNATGATLTISNWAAPIVPFTVTATVPARAWVGAATTAATRVTDRHGRAVARRRMTLQKMPRGQTTWHLVGSATTTSTGAASYRFANSVSARYRWVSAATTGAPSKISRTVAVVSTARVSQSRPASSTTRGRYLSVQGTVSRVPDPAVYIQYRYAGGAWHTGPRATVRGALVSGRVALRVRGAAATRLYVAGKASYAGSISRYHITSVR